MDAFPQVLLLGNGLNRAYGGGDWFALIEKIHTNSKVDLDTMKEVPFPLQAVLATDNHISNIIKNNQSFFYGVENIDELKLQIQKILKIPFDHIFTTNYSYEIERTANSKVSLDGKHCKQLMRHTDFVNRSESKYLLHTYNEISYGDLSHKVWHIHGEARKRESIVLDHDFYGKLLGKYQMLTKRGDRQYEPQKMGKNQ